MIRYLTFLLFAIFSFQILSAEDRFEFAASPRALFETRFSQEELDAPAVVIYENCHKFYWMNTRIKDFEIITDYIIRIKIMNPEGIEYANNEIFLYKKRNAFPEEEIMGLSGWTYNLDDNKLIKSRLSQDSIHTEDFSEYQKKIRFTMPNVKVGSIIEYRYRQVSPYYYYPQRNVFQRLIPVKESYFKINIPEYFTFSRTKTGYESVQIKSAIVEHRFSFGGRTWDCSAEEIKVSVKNLPPLNKGKYDWYYDDFLTAIQFNFHQIKIPGTYYKDYSQVWNNAVSELNSSYLFGKQLRKKDFFKSSLSSVLADKTSEADSIHAILNYIQEKVTWNGTNSLIIQNQERAFNEGSGSSGEINALLLNALQNAELKAYPVALRLRSNGKITYTDPDPSSFNYFIVCVSLGENKYYLDATRPYPEINVIPNDCLVEEAMIIYPHAYEWIDLSHLKSH